MRRITLWTASTVSALVLLFSYHTSTNAAAGTSVVALAGNGSAGSSAGGTTDPGTTSDSGSSSSDSPDSGSSSSDQGSTADSGSSDSAASAGTYTGDAVGTRYGDVQVEITVTDGKVTASRVVQVPWNDHKDQEINTYAVPILNEEAVAAQSADIDMVSGATYTSEGYIGSLQSALDQAGL
ncbi:FMN-binding protein [Oryzobacter terrae]|uniref:FMN-binding protein n=1 Tax=Oryzobacter terrae TaxID=1620385 RepID=UPI00366BCD2B